MEKTCAFTRGDTPLDKVFRIDRKEGGFACLLW